MEILKKLNILLNECDIIEKKVDLKIDTRITEDLHLDSLDVLEFIIDVEDAFNIKIPESKAEEFVLIADLINFIDIQKGKNS